MRRGDFAILVLYCLLLYGSVLISGRPISGHEAVVPQGAREMIAHQDWLVPTCGGLPWLERPPLPHWIIGGLIAVTGSSADWLVRWPSVLVGAGIVCLAAWLASLWYGRSMGVLTGLVLATMWEFAQYASNPESDIFLCAIVTAAIALFVKQEFGEPDERRSFFGTRSWPVLSFFVLLGLTNLVKGLIFGTLMVLVPVGCFLLLRFDLQAIRRYLWLWGWLAFAVVWLAWPVAVYQRYPDVVDLWLSDYVGRLNQGHVAEPVWHYLVVWPWVVGPWTICSLVGLYATAGQAWRERGSPERFLWCWAVLTIVFFSIPQGKHHHYLLQCIVPWAVLAARGATRFWEVVASWPAWLRSPWLGGGLLGLAGDVALLLAWQHLPGPVWLVPLLLVVWPVVAFGLCWAVTQRQGALAIATYFSLLLLIFSFLNIYRGQYLSNYFEEMTFLQQIDEHVPADQPLYVNFDRLYPLETFRLLFYSRPTTALLQNLTYLRDERICQPEVWILARYGDRAQLATYGSWDVALQSDSRRGVNCDDDLRTLFHLRFNKRLRRYPADGWISPMQATHREPGPFLGRSEE